MEDLKQKRKPLRQGFTVTAGTLELELAKADVQIDRLKILMSQLTNKFERLNDVQTQISEFLLKLENEDDYLKDFESNEVYIDRYITLKEMVQSRLLNSEYDTKENSVESKRKFKLPTLELQKFNGEIKNWLVFWGQFRKIHDDNTIDDDDKFQYLVQAMVPGSPARELVDSFPPSGQNYKKAIDQLKSRFARDDLLVEIYIRELLGLVLAQATKKGNMTLATLYDKLETQLRALESLGVKSDIYAAMLYPLVESALPEDLLKAWERSRSSGQTNARTENLANLLTFLRIEVESEERLQIARSGFGSQGSFDLVPPTAACIYTGDSKNYMNDSKKLKCIWCDKETHSSVECFKLHNLSFNDKKNILKEKRACYCCLKIGHSAQKCKSSVKCLICNKRHITVMCWNIKKGESQDQTKPSTKEKMEESSSSKTLVSQQKGETLMQTLIVKVEGADKTDRLARVLLDSGSQRSYIKTEGVEKLNLPKAGEETLKHTLFGGIETGQEKHNIYDVCIKSLDGHFKITCSMLDQSKICSFVPRLKTQNIYRILQQKSINLSDVGESPLEIKLLLGADVIPQLLTGKIEKLDDNIVAIETRLGWTVMGQEQIKEKNNTILSLFCQPNIEDLWTLETIGIRDPAETKTTKAKNEEILESFQQTVHTDVSGRYEVSLPWKDSHPTLLNNHELARTRLMTLTKRLERIGKFEEYDKVLKEWLQEGIIEIDENYEEPGSHYLPHQAVIKESSQTTKLRPVFDASSKDGNGTSLNSCLESGPNLVENIPKMLTQFRKYSYGITSDIRKAFLQIGITENDRKCLKFLWWNKIEKEIINLRHRRVVFGLTCSPFLLNATILHHLQLQTEEFVETAKELSKSFYVDNCVISIEEGRDVEKFIREATILMTKGKFDLRSWITNVTQKNELRESTENIVPILGLVWDTQKDELFCEISSVRLSTQKLTKRTLLSISQKIFDPLGILCPATLVPKLLLQEAWKADCGWDQELPENISKKFIQWLEKIQWLRECRISRHMHTFNASLSIHIFCDASKAAYAACVFLRSQKEKNVVVKLVMAKARISPMKKVTIPRLELLAAVLGSRLYLEILKAFDNQKIETYFYTDSQVILTWLKKEDNWTIFVKNRCEEIRNNTNVEDWYHISSEQNAADLPSRGCCPETLYKNKWWDGPKWLKEEKEKWPKNDFHVIDNITEEKKTSTTSSVVSIPEEFSAKLLYFSKYHKIVRVIGWILRFKHNIQTKAKKRVLDVILSSMEYSEAEIILLKLIQNETFKSEKDKRIKNMQVFQDENGLIRVKTKLLLGEEDVDFKTPVLLPNHHPIVYRLLREIHETSLHAGLQIMLSRVREKYWVCGARRLIRKIISRCTICQRFNAKSFKTPSASLPKDRITNSATFQTTGIDYAGPLYLKTGEKSWIVLFTCAVYRCLHLELVQNLSTHAFLDALRRFIARRGRVETIYTDNGTNFHGANNKLRELNWKEIQDSSTIHRINWKFIPPSSAWWGGFWERMVRTTKEILRRILGRATLSYEELSTILCDCEAVVNSRPLTYVFDEDNLTPLTPAMFLNSLSSTEVTDLDKIDSTILNSRYQYLQNIRENLRQRFRTEYLAQLIHRGKESNNSLKQGDIVLIGDDNVKRMNWPLAIVLELYPGKDGIPRVAKLKTTHGEKIRPLPKLFPLEVSSAETDLFNLKSAIPISKEIKENITRYGRKIKIPNRLDL